MEEKIMAILQEIRSDVDFEREDGLVDNGILESFDVIQIVTTLMDTFDISIDADDIEPENLNSFKAICALVEQKLDG